MTTTALVDIEGAGGRATAFQGDVVEPADMAHVFDAAQEPDGGWVNAQVVRVNGGLA